MPITYDRKDVFDGLRPLFRKSLLSDSQVAGIEAILAAWERLQPNGDTRWLAYALATAHLETNETMQPVREAYWLSEQWRRAHLRYFPYYGRGFVQLTWLANYQTATRRLRQLGVLSAQEDLAKTLDLAMRLDVAAAVMIYGMIEGWFTTKKLADYFGAKSDWVAARHIINGTDRAATIAATAQKIFAALHHAMVFTDAAPPKPAAAPAPVAPAAAIPAPAPAAKPGLFARIGYFFGRH